MIRPFTFITMVLAAVSGAYLFAVKHRSQVLDDQIAALSQSSRLDEMRIRVLQGQWSLEIDPTRLQQLAAQFTTLQPMAPAQLVTLAALRVNLPAPGSAAPGGNPELPNQMAPQSVGPALAQNGPAPGALPLPPPLPPPAPAMLLARAAPGPARPAGLPPAGRVVAYRVSQSALHVSNAELAGAMPSKPFYVPNSRRKVAPVMQASAIAPSTPIRAQVLPVRATATAAQYISPPVMAAQDVDQGGGSALGVANNIPPPQPMPLTGSDN